MALDTAFYLVTSDIAKRSGLYGKRYIAPDGRFILDNKDLSRVRFTTDEYISGLAGVERIASQAEAQALIAAGGYNMTPSDTSHDRPRTEYDVEIPQEDIIEDNVVSEPEGEPTESGAEDDSEAAESTETENPTDTPAEEE